MPKASRIGATRSRCWPVCTTVARSPSAVMTGASLIASGRAPRMMRTLAGIIPKEHRRRTLRTQRWRVLVGDALHSVFQMLDVEVEEKTEAMTAQLQVRV